MNKELISSKQAISIIFMFLMGTAVILGGNTDAKQDSWIALIVAVVAAVPMVLIYARIIKLYPGMDLFDIVIKIFGNILGKIIIILFTWYCLHLLGLVLRSFSDFIQTCTLPETPTFPIILVIGLLAAYAVKSGIETLGKCSLLLCFAFTVIFAFTMLLSAKDMDFSNILPILGPESGNIPSSAFKLFTLPLTECVLFTTIASCVKTEDSPYKIYFWGLIFSGLALLLIFLRNMFVVGYPFINDNYYPSYSTMRIISIGENFTRVEITVSANFFVAGFVKAAVCLFGACKGMAKLFNFKDYRQLVFPTLLMGLAVSRIVFSNMIELFEDSDVYKYYTLPFLVILPIIIFITAQIKHRSKVNDNLKSDV